MEWGGGGGGGGEVKPAAFLHAFSCTDECVRGGNLPFTEAASSTIYKNSTRLQWCACTPAFIRTKIRIPSPLLHAHSALLASPVAPSRLEAAVMAGLLLWSGRARYFSDGQKREIHLVSALRKIPMHGGGSDLAAGLNHVMRAPRGSESLSERVDFTPKGGRKEREGKSKEKGGGGT